MLLASKKSFSGPLPQPSDYAEYGQVEPTAPERILRQWETESDHRRAYEMKALEGSLKLGATGLRNALIFALAALGSSVAAMYFGMEAVAGIIGGGTITAGIGAFIYRQRKGAAEQAKAPE